MLASTPVSFQSKPYDPTWSPSCRSHQGSMRRPTPNRSPLRQRPLFSAHPAALDDRYHGELTPLQSPYRTPTPSAWSAFASNSHYVADDESGTLPESPSVPAFPLARPLFTPVKQSSRVVDGLNATPSPQAPATLGTGLKRKSVPTRQSTPLRQHSLTPLAIDSAGYHGSGEGHTLDRLAPLPPIFSMCTPQVRKETDLNLHHETATMTRLRILDLNESDDESEPGNDSGCDLGADVDDDDDDARGDALFIGHSAVSEKSKIGAALRLAGRGKDDEEVAEAVSPGGHIVKRRARARPLSEELVRNNTPQFLPSRTAPKTGLNFVAFPTATTEFREHASPSSSSSETGSPVPRCRVSGLHPLVQTRTPFARADSATLFFSDPSITNTPSGSSSSCSHKVASLISSDAADSSFANGLRPKVMNRHSYSGSGSLTSTWRQAIPSSSSASPQTSPSHAVGGSESYDTDDNDSMLVDLPENSSFILNITEESPKRSGQGSDHIVKKYTRDSGIALSDDDDDMYFLGSSSSTEPLSKMPQASTSVSSLYSDFEDGLVTPGVAPRSSSGWPDAVIVSATDYAPFALSQNGQDVDAFILRTLATAAKGSHEIKKAPGTPVKKSKVSYLAGQRPWQSAVARKVGFGIHAEEKPKKVPRKSMPAAFPSLGRKSNKYTLDPSTDSDSEFDDSPSNRKEKYVGLGIGFPSLAKDGAPRNRWLMRRSSSGAFSSGSDSMSVAATPTRNRGLEDRFLPPGPSNFPMQFSPSRNRMKLSPSRSASGSSNGSVASPSMLRKLPIAESKKYRGARFSGRARLLSQPAHKERPGRYESQFVEIAEVGSGEFGKVLKVRTKDGNSDKCFAIKKSKRFEGGNHRLRLREEVETLQHLTHVGGARPHPNVLDFIDAWEEDDQLFIWTELCEGGNFAHFLWEYGRVFPRLDQARVWKIVVELSNGLKFIHDSGIIHLDLKPANIFLTGEGRFKIGDFGMAALWPRPRPAAESPGGSFEREGDKLYLAPEVLQGKYGKAADMFSFGMTILETASNIVVPDQGEAWHRLRREDFSQVNLDDSPEVLRLVRQMMRRDPSLRVGIHGVYNHPVVSRARVRMEQAYETAKRAGTSLFAASPLASVSEEFLPTILGN
ncbi:hypothetical protein D9757_000714 [Collybiopsis confluens]|uniref:Protein kinase domain-containing protein n=1 Tax=Collybiopsis confluens TaxID=2823264 RepID=A0A8H5I1L7_9AGAR|nr:hypothetical protein D9757_000714 [Collybiopsis confluens]